MRSSIVLNAVGEIRGSFPILQARHDPLNHGNESIVLAHVCLCRM